MKTFLIFILVSVTSLTQVRFAVIGDYGKAGPNEQAVANLVYSWNPDLIITVGDNNYENGELSTIDINIGQYYHSYIYPYIGIYGIGSDTNRFFPSLGNHDWYTPLALPYLTYFTLPDNERYYDFIWENIHFFALDSDQNEPDGTNQNSIQANWLQNELQNSSSQRWKIVYFHHPPYSSGQHGSSTYMRWPFKQWGVHIVLSGHDHTYERLIVNDLTYFVNGLGGKSIYSFSNTILPQSIERYNGNYGAMLIEAYQTELICKFISVDGNLRDSTKIIDVSLPVELKSFTGKYTDGRIILKWRTETEINNYGFEIHRKTQDDNWKLLGFVGGYGNSNSPKDYSFLDDNITTGSYYYRLKQIDSDGSFTYSNEIKIVVDFTPKEFMLYQNYPNPFNPETTIKFQIASSGKVKLIINDVLGKEIKTLVNEFKNIGSYEVKFNAENLAGGTYFYKLVANDFISIKKMIFQK